MDAPAAPQTFEPVRQFEFVSVEDFLNAFNDVRLLALNLRAELEKLQTVEEEKRNLLQEIARLNERATADKQTAERKLTEAVQRVQEDWRKDSKELRETNANLIKAVDNLQISRAEVVRQRDAAELKVAQRIRSQAEENCDLKAEIRKRSELYNSLNARFETLRQFVMNHAAKLTDVAASHT